MKPKIVLTLLQNRHSMFFDNELWKEIQFFLSQNSDFTHQKKTFQMLPRGGKITEDEDFSKVTYRSLQDLWDRSQLDIPCDVHLVVMVYPHTAPDIEIKNASTSTIYCWTDSLQKINIPSIQPIIPTLREFPHVFQCPYVILPSVNNAILEHKAKSPMRDIDVFFCGNTDDVDRQWRKEWLIQLGHALPLDKLFLKIDSSIHFESYAEFLVRSKVVVCPRGIAEHTWRMFEAIIAGAYPIAQEICHEKWWSNTHPPIDFFSYDPDEAAQMCLQALDQWEEKSRTAQEWYAKTYSKERITKWVSEISSRILQR